MTLPAPTIVIFDMDGTSVRHLSPKILTMLEWLDNRGHQIGSIFSWIFRRGAQGNPMQDWEDHNARKKPRLLVHRAMHKLRRKEVDQIVEPCPGIYKVLDLLRAKNIPMAIASNGLGKGYGHDILEKFDLEQYFAATIFREDIIKSKPHPDGILLALKETESNLKANDVIWYIGDRRKDIKAAIAAQQHLPCTITPLAYGLSATLEALRQNLGPENIIPSYDDMHTKLTALFK